MAKKSKQDLKAFEAHLRYLVKTSEPHPFTAEEIWQILHRHGMPKDLSQYRDEGRIEIMEKIHKQQLAQAEANFRNPAQMHSLGELLDSTLIIKNMFISQLAQELELTAEEIEDYIENRRPTRPWREDQMQKLAELTGIAIEEIRRIAAETARNAEMQTRASDEAKSEPAPKKPRRPYPMPSDHFTVWMIRDEESSNYKKR